MVIVSFSEDMHIVPSLSMLKSGTVAIRGEELPVFKVEVVPGSDSDPAKLYFTWNVVEMTERQISI